MMWELYLVLTVFAGVCTLAVLLVRESVLPLGLLAAGLWSVLALQARNIVIYHQDGTTTTTGSEPWQFVALGLAVLMVGVSVLYWWGVFPPEDEQLVSNSV